MELKSGFSRYEVYSLPLNYGKNVAQQVGLNAVNIDADSSGLSIISTSGLTTIGDASFIPIITINNLFQEVAGFTYVRGPHSIKFGGDLRRRQTDPFQSPTARRPPSVGDHVILTTALYSRPPAGNRLRICAGRARDADRRRASSEGTG